MQTRWGRDIPKWAADLLARIEAEEHVRVGAVTWRRSTTSRHDLSSGHTWPARRAIVITAGKNRADQRLVLLHEVAHVWRVQFPGGLRAAHDREMWRLAWTLYRKYATSTTVRHILEREGAYRTTALSVAKEMGLRGAATALRERRKRNAADPQRHAHHFTILRAKPAYEYAASDLYAVYEGCDRIIADGTECGWTRIGDRRLTDEERARWAPEPEAVGA